MLVSYCSTTWHHNPEELNTYVSIYIGSIYLNVSLLIMKIPIIRPILPVEQVIKFDKIFLGQPAMAVLKKCPTFQRPYLSPSPGNDVMGDCCLLFISMIGVTFL
jgi:hypothetical protein